MKLKKKMGVFLSLLTALTVFAPSLNLHAEGNGGTMWFQDQLESQQRLFYNAISSLYDSGGLKTGTASVDMKTMGITDAQIKDYADGDTGLAQAFHDANDAFFYDHEDVFYVNPAKLTLRVGSKSDGSYSMVLGRGSNADYYADGFSSENDVNAALVAIESSRDAILSNVDRSSSVDAQVTAAHNALIDLVTYKYPADASDNELPYLDSIYGSLVNGVSQCQGYAKAFKYLMDELQIPCVLIYGVRNFDTSDTGSSVPYEEHMWNYVQINGNWFAVDTTWDDPIGGSLRDNYLLKGSGQFDADHVERGQVSSGGMTFTYPELYVNDFKDVPIEYEEPVFKISQSRYVTGEDAISSFTVSYNGITEEEAASADPKISYAFRLSMKNNDSQWSQWTPLPAYTADKNGVAEALSEEDGGGYRVSAMHEGYIQFLITTAPYGNQPYLYNEGCDPAAEEYAVTSSNPLKVENFVENTAPPMVASAVPTQECIIRPNGQWIELEFDERLELSDENTPAGIDVENTQDLLEYSVSDVSYTDSSYLLGNGSVRESTKVKFYFVPDKTYQAEVNTYRFTVTNMQGKYSKLAPNGVNYKTHIAEYLPCPLRKYTSPPTAFVIGDPLLVADDKLNMFTTEGGTKPYNSLHIQLVATKPDSGTQSTIDEKLAEDLGGAKQLSSSSYDITLSCRNAVAHIRPGYKVMIGLPYPDGYDYRKDENVVFKAYHFKYDSTSGTYLPEELICQITPSGLMVMAESFSPFTVVALDKSTVTEDTSVKTAMISLGSLGGNITAAGDETFSTGIESFKDGETKTYCAAADPGYVIEKVVIDGAEAEIADGLTTYEKTFSYADMNASSSLEVYFAAESTIAEESAEGITPVIPGVVPVETPDVNPDDKPVVDPDDKPVVDPDDKPVVDPDDKPVVDPDDKPVVDPDDKTDTTYKKVSLTDETTKISIAGSLTEHNTLQISSEIGQNALEAFTKASAGGTILNTYDVSLSDAQGYKGSLTLTFPVDAAYEGQKLLVLHYLNNTVESYGALVQNGQVTVTVTSLSPFAVVLPANQDEVVIPPVNPDNNDGNNNNNNNNNNNPVIINNNNDGVKENPEPIFDSKDSPSKAEAKTKKAAKTGDTLTAAYVYSGLALAALCFLLVVLRKKKHLDK